MKIECVPNPLIKIVFTYDEAVKFKEELMRIGYPSSFIKSIMIELEKVT